MTHPINHKKIKQLLTDSTSQLDARTLSALQSARQNALQHQKVKVSGLQLSSGHLLPFHLSHGAQKWLIAILLAATFVSIGEFWQHQHEQQISEIDAAILSDELPIDVFID